MALKLSVRVGQSVSIGGPATLRVEAKSGRVVALSFDADRSVPIRIIANPEREETGAPKPRGEPVGIGLATGQPQRAASSSSRAHDVPGLTRSKL